MARMQSLKRRINSVSFWLILTGIISFSSAYFTYQTMLMKTAHAKSLQDLKAFVKSASISMAESQSAFRGYLLDPKREALFEEKLKLDTEARGFLLDAKKLVLDPQLLQIFDGMIAVDREMDPMEEKIQKEIKTQKNKTVDYFNATYLPMFNKRNHAMSMAIEYSVELHGKAVREANLWISITFGVIAGLFISLIIGISIYCSRLARSLSKDLEDVNSMILNEATEVSDVSVKLAESSQSLSDSTTTQAAAIEETVSSMEEIGSMLSQTSQNASDTLRISKESAVSTDRGKTAVTKLRQAMAEIDAANARLIKIVSLIGEIRNKTRVINEIVSETRLLSFNASIEAARAGSHGRGFAVVAEEIGKLALMSGKAAEEIRTLLESGTQEVSEVVSTTQDKVTVGKMISEECEEAFEDMSQSLSQIGESVRLITNATREQESGVKQTNQAMNEMDLLTQKNSSAIGNLALQASTLSSNSISLKSSVIKLKQIILGSESKQISESINEASKEIQSSDKIVKLDTFKQKISKMKDVAKKVLLERNGAAPTQTTAPAPSSLSGQPVVSAKGEGTPSTSNSSSNEAKDAKKVVPLPSRGEVKRNDSRWRTG